MYTYIQNGKTALQLAQNVRIRQKGHDEVVAVLQGHMASVGRK
jgi:hypothetical protein